MLLILVFIRTKVRIIYDAYSLVKIGVEWEVAEDGYEEQINIPKE